VYHNLKEKLEKKNNLEKKHVRGNITAVSSGSREYKDRSKKKKNSQKKKREGGTSSRTGEQKKKLLETPQKGSPESRGKGESKDGKGR